jgi:NADH:ubiquinone reductase (H+-translocating)
MTKRIVVLGGGFGGLAATQRLDRIFRHDNDVDVTLISDTNFLVYTPMLAAFPGGDHRRDRCGRPTDQAHLRHRRLG